MAPDKPSARGYLFLMAAKSDVVPFLSFLIPAYNEERHIVRALASVQEALAALSEEEYEIIVCDNNSADGTGELAAGMGARVVFEPHNQISRARNAAAGVARGNWFIFLDADSEVSVELLEETLRRIRAGNTGAGGALIAFDRWDLKWAIALGLWTWNCLSRTMHWAAGSYIFCQRAAWEETGGFSEEWYAAEEIIFSRMLKRWCRAHGLGFEIITGSRLRTSSRKVENYSFLQLLRLLLGLALPGALKSRARCHYWYNRSS